MKTSSTEPLVPALIVIFGITGDLSRRKLMPALYELVKNKLLPPGTKIVGISRREVDTESLLESIRSSIIAEDKVCDPAVLAKLKEILLMSKMDLKNSADYEKLREYLNQLDAASGQCMNRLFYLSVPPGAVSGIVKNLGECSLNASCQHGQAAARLLVEKPFGYDQTSGQRLIEETAKYFAEEQIFRIDHYVAKETVQNILTFRFRNPIFESIWDKDHISSIDITASETIDIEGRAAFYEQTGALRDLVQSHLMQLLATAAMEKPEVIASDEIHAAKLKLLESVRPAEPEDSVRGQYNGYRREVKNSSSTTETFVSLKLEIDNAHWRGVPITLRTGKALKKKETKIEVTFKPAAGDNDHANVLSFFIQPNEGINIDLWVKRPGFERQLQTASMSFSYQRTFDEHGHPDAYERVLVDAVRGDHTLFATSAEVMASWRILQPLLTSWAANSEGLLFYPKGGEPKS